jgi:hypothetical protein
MSRGSNLPMVGDLIGRVCGPCEFPRDFQGRVIRVYSDNWYDNNADIAWDDGSTDSWVGAYVERGIGVYLLERAKEVA